MLSVYFKYIHSLTPSSITECPPWDEFMCYEPQIWSLEVKWRNQRRAKIHSEIQNFHKAEGTMRGTVISSLDLKWDSE